MFLLRLLYSPLTPSSYLIGQSLIVLLQVLLAIMLSEQRIQTKGKCAAGGFVGSKNKHNWLSCNLHVAHAGSKETFQVSHVRTDLHRRDKENIICHVRIGPSQSRWEEYHNYFKMDHKRGNEKNISHVKMNHHRTDKIIISHVRMHIHRGVKEKFNFFVCKFYFQLCLFQSVCLCWGVVCGRGHPWRPENGIYSSK